MQESNGVRGFDLRRQILIKLFSLHSVVCDASGVDNVCDVRKVCDVWQSEPAALRAYLETQLLNSPTILLHRLCENAF